MFVAITFLCLHNFYFATNNIEVRKTVGRQIVRKTNIPKLSVKGCDHSYQGPTYAAVMFGAGNVGIFATLPFVTPFVLNTPLRWARSFYSECIGAFWLLALLWVYLFHCTQEIRDKKGEECPLQILPPQVQIKSVAEISDKPKKRRASSPEQNCSRDKRKAFHNTWTTTAHWKICLLPQQQTKESHGIQSWRRCTL